MKTEGGHMAKYALDNFECEMCTTGIVQIHRQWKRGGIDTTIVSGCLDCKYEYGLRQASNLNPYKRDDICWP